MIFAKSGGITLQEHIQDCLQVSKELKISLTKLFEDFGFNDLLTLAILFHDFGKLYPEFQKVLLKKDNKWENQRHEIYSVIFSNKIKMNKDDRALVQKAILSHHKSFDKLREKHLTAKELQDDFKDIWQSKGEKHHPKDVLKNLSKFRKTDLKEMIEFIVSYLDHENINYSTQPVIYSEQKHPIDELVLTHKAFEMNSVEFFKNLLFSGLLKMCDHYGSAKIDTLPNLRLSDFNFLDLLKPFYHQTECWQSSINTILIAPTGSGKTECALGWLKQSLHQNNGRTFYILPYTASINAMHKRLCKQVENIHPVDAKLIGIQHGKIEQYLDQYIEDDYELLREKSDSFKKIVHPFKITTPFQILKYFFGVKTFEIGFVNLYGAKIIFDEIHAYDVLTFAQLVVVISFLTKYFQASIFVMTATLPTFQRKEIEKALQNSKMIKPTYEFLQSKIRHRLSIFEGDVFTAIDDMKFEISNAKQVMFVLNKVDKAQECYLKLQEMFPDEKMCLIHGRFTANDRTRNEKTAFEKDTKFLIGTQAIEVSLDIDYDLMITDPAPLDALLQRFGRVNRKGIKEQPSPIYICMKSAGNDSMIYPKEIVQKTLDVLANVDILKEIDVQALIDEVYPNWLPDQKREYEDTKILFENSLQSLQPYSKDKEREEEFYERFDGIQVLPAGLYKEYKSLIESGKFIQADGMMVGIHRSIYRILRGKDQILTEYFDLIKGGKIKRHSVMVAQCKYNCEIGLLTDTKEEIDYGDSIFC